VELGRAHVAVDAVDGRLLGFAALGFIDGEPYLDQLSVRRHAMRRGIGSALLEHAITWAGTRPLWITTYSHIPWNAPFYERVGFERVPELECGREMRAVLAEQRAALPAPDERIAMVKR
jgi:GNAT superfamily N-acetyltransferase